MGNVIKTVTFLGSTTPHPQAPPRNTRGNLEAEPSALIFRPSGHGKPFSMLWWSFKSCKAEQVSPDGMDNLFWTAASPLSLMTLGLFSGEKATVSIEYWDEDYALTDTVYFQVGGLHDMPRAQQLASNIWDWRARYYRALRDGAGIKRK